MRRERALNVSLRYLSPPLPSLIIFGTYPSSKADSFFARENASTQDNPKQPKKTLASGDIAETGKGVSR